jgi:sec-independent protein translocase protein TatC
MPFLEHLEELRWRILYSLVAVAVGTALGWVVVNHYDLLDLLKRPIAPYLPGGRLTFTSPTEPFMLTLKLAFATGVVLASPVVIYQIWAFLAPALYPREKRLIVPALSVGVVLFLAGAVVAYLVVLPAALQVLFTFQREDLTALITIDRYFGFAVPLILAFGLVTELPLVVAILAALGLVTPRFLARNRRYALVIAAFGAALLTPPDAVSMLMMMVPLVLLYEIGILAAWVAARRRARRVQAAPGTAALVVLLLASGAGLASAQQPTPPRRPARAAAAKDTLARARGTGQPGVDSVRAGQPIDTATARLLGLPAGPSRSFPATDPVLDSLLRLEGYVKTRYLADTLTVEGDSQVIVLRGHSFLEREGTQLEADSVRYREGACRLDAIGEPKLFDESSVLVAKSMRYDTCRRRGIVTAALTDFEQEGTDWFMRGDLAVDSGSTRLYGSGSDVTSCALPEPHYHFAAGKVKWLNRNVMVARPAVLYVRDVPILWMPFIFQDIRTGRRSGMLVPRFGLNDLIRTSGDYRRHVANIGYYFVLNDYLDALGAVDWYSGNYLQYRAQVSYRVLSRFLTGTLAYTRIN